MTSVASHSISSVRPDIATHKSYKEQHSDASFEAMLDSSLPEAGNERLGDDGARNPGPSAPAPSASGPSDAAAGGPGDSPAKSGKTDSRGAKPASTKAVDGKPADTKPADDVGTCEDEQDFALAEDADDAATEDAADALVTPEMMLAAAPAPDATAGTPTAVAAPVQTDVVTSTTPSATTDATDIAAKSTSGSVMTPNLAPTDSVGGIKTTQTAAAGPRETSDIGKQAAAPGDQAAPVKTNADTSALSADVQVDPAADPTVAADPASAKAPDISSNSPAATAAADNSTLPQDAARATPAAAAPTGMETVTAQTAPEQPDDTIKDAKGSENGRPEDAKGRGPEGAERKPDAPAGRDASARQGPPGSEQGIASRSARATEVLAEKAPQALGGNPDAGENKGAETKPGHAHAIHAAELASAHLSATDTPSVTSATTAADATALDTTRAAAAAAQPLATGAVTPAGTTTPNAPYANATLAPVPVSGLAVEIVAQARDGKSRFEIRLDPPELGRIDVHLHVDRDGTVTSRLLVERSETLDLLKRDAPTLERALQNAGLKTGDQGLAFSLRDHGAGRHQDNGHTAHGSRVIIPDDAQPLSLAGNTYGRRLGLGTGVDIRV